MYDHIMHHRRLCLSLVTVESLLSLLTAQWLHSPRVENLTGYGLGNRVTTNVERQCTCFARQNRGEYPPREKRLFTPLPLPLADNDMPTLNYADDRTKTGGYYLFRRVP